MESFATVSKPSVFDVLDKLPTYRPDCERMWIAEGASDALRGFINESDYTTKRARACYRLGYYLAERLSLGGAA